MFLVPLDRRRGWYRYHALFREFLLGELRRVEPDVIPKLHLRAADWYEANGSPALAVEHLLHTSERDRCVQLVTTLVLPTHNLGQLSTVERWLSALGDAAIEAYPPLAVLAGWVASTGRTHHRRATVGDGHRHRDRSKEYRSTARRRSTRRGRCCGASCVPPVPSRPCATGCSRSPPSRRGARGAIKRSASAARRYLLTGDLERARALFAESAGVSAASDRRVRRERVRARVARRWIAGNGPRRPSTPRWRSQPSTHNGCTTTRRACSPSPARRGWRVHRGDVQEANRQLTRAMRARPACTFALPGMAVRARLQLAKVYWANADHTTARHLLREIDDILLHRPDLGVLVDEVSQFRDVVASSVGAEPAARPRSRPRSCACSRTSRRT